MHTITIGTRGSKLALWQAHYAATLLRAADPQAEVSVRVISTKGDDARDIPLARIGGKGLFTKELEYALTHGEVDVCVHSMKDVPSQLPCGLLLAGCLARADARDALVTFSRVSFMELAPNARVGTGSLRRSSQLKRLRNDLDYVEIRGNVDTRVSKAREGSLEAVVLAAAGLQRMGLGADIAQRFGPGQIVPAVGQGAIGLEIRSDDDYLAKICARICCYATGVCVAAERRVMIELEGGCQAPMGAYARFEEGSLVLNTYVGSLDGNIALESLQRANLAYPLHESDLLSAHETAEKLALTVVGEMTSRGAREVLAAARKAVQEVVES